MIVIDTNKAYQLCVVQESTRGLNTVLPFYKHPYTKQIGYTDLDAQNKALAVENKIVLAAYTAIGNAILNGNSAEISYHIALDPANSGTEFTKEQIKELRNGFKLWVGLLAAHNGLYLGNEG